MFIGHIPAGYILTKIIQKKIKIQYCLFIGLIGSIFPDLDMLYFYLIDNRQHLHHSYWTHIPFYWLSIAVIILALLRILKKKTYLIAAIIFLSNIFLHLFLDTLFGKIAWLFPFTDKAYYLFEVPSVHSFWIYNFIFHWTFLFEIGVITWAIYLFFKDRENSVFENTT